MREILFRGKHIHALLQNKHLDGAWVYGYLCDEDYISVIDEDEYGGKFTSEVLIDPETVCQYTGLTDKNGRKIFERDILEVCTFGFNSERFITEVIYDKCAFKLKNGRSMFYYGQSDFTKMDDAKVIGNIFDNPELITQTEI